MNRYQIIALLVFISIFTLNSEVVGIAQGFSPYQFYDKEKEIVTGLDAELIEAILSNINIETDFFMDSWDNVVAQFKFSNKIDLVTGMEVTELRKSFALFSRVLYYRTSAIFVLEDSPIESYRDLVEKVVTGDRDSYIEKILKDESLKEGMRLKQTNSKEVSFQLLKKGEAEAAIMPETVGFYLARKYNVNVKIIHRNPEGTPVAIAVKHDNKALLNRINTSINQIQSSGELDKIIHRWRLQN